MIIIILSIMIIRLSSAKSVMKVIHSLRIRLMIFSLVLNSRDRTRHWIVPIAVAHSMNYGDDEKRESMIVWRVLYCFVSYHNN